jgi:hypothetical protein
MKPDDGGGKFLWNNGQYLPDCYLKRQPSLSWTYFFEPQITTAFGLFINICNMSTDVKHVSLYIPFFL